MRILKLEQCDSTLGDSSRAQGHWPHEHEIKQNIIGFSKDGHNVVLTSTR